MMANQQPPPEIGDWVERLIWAGVALFALFKDRILGWLQSRADRQQQHHLQSEQTSLEQLLSSHGKLADFTITISSGLLSKIEQGVYKTIEQTRQTNTGLQFDRQHWEQVAERDEEFLRWIQQVSERLSGIETRLDVIEVVLKVEGPKKGIHDTQERRVDTR